MTRKRKPTVSEQERMIHGLRKAVKNEQKVVNSFVIMVVELEQKVRILEAVAQASTDYTHGLSDSRYAIELGGIKELKHVLMEALQTYAEAKRD